MMHQRGESDFVYSKIILGKDVITVKRYNAVFENAENMR